MVVWCAVLVVSLAAFYDQVQRVFFILETGSTITQLKRAHGCSSVRCPAFASCQMLTSSYTCTYVVRMGTRVLRRTRVCTRVRTFTCRCTVRVSSKTSTIATGKRACEATSACIASLRGTVSVVVRVCGFHGWSSCLGTCSPGSGAVRVSSQPVAGRFVDASTCLQDERVSWSAYFAAFTAT